MAPKVLAADLPLTAECQHYETLGEVPWDIRKYWHQRYSIFSEYDSGIYLTDDAWFGVTPEPVAEKIAHDIIPALLDDRPLQATGSDSSESGLTVIDLFAGVGGNAIAFARSGLFARVIAVERDAATLACAQHNAATYGVSENAITWVLGDAFEVLAELREGSMPRETAAHDKSGRDRGADSGNGLKGTSDTERTAVFASPPWGGVGYVAHEVFDLDGMQPYGLRELHEACGALPHALYLPRTGDLRQIAGLVPESTEQGKIEVVQYCMRGASKAMVAYFPRRPR